MASLCLGLHGHGRDALYAYSNNGTIAGYTGATAESGSGVFGGIPAGDTSSVNYNVTSAGTFAEISSSSSVNTIAYSGSGATQPAASNTSLTVNGIMNTGTGPLTIGGSPRIDVTIGSNKELVVATMTGGVVINNNISDSSAGAMRPDQDRLRQFHSRRHEYLHRSHHDQCRHAANRKRRRQRIARDRQRHCRQRHAGL